MKKIKAFISIDLEGMPYIVIPGHLSLKGTLYTEARKIASKITLIVAEELKNAGFDDILRIFNQLVLKIKMVVT